jgi:hypothetical protein
LAKVTTTTVQASSQGNLLRNIVLFGRLLRELGVDVTPPQILDLVAALNLVDLRRREDVKNTCRAVLISRKEHIVLFDEAFELFWKARESRDLQGMDLGMLLRRRPQAQEQYRLIRNPGESDSPRQTEEEPRVDKVYTYSELETLREKDFAKLSEYELELVKRFMQDTQWELERRRTRRRVSAARGKHLDMRRTFRRNLRHGSEILHLSYRQQKLKRRPVVMLCDISGSMDRYARVLLQFMYAISNNLDRVETFVFSTRLTRITRQLQHRDIDQALDEASSVVEDWAGGTRIGEVLRTFNYDWARRVLGQGAIVMIISDGWDRGDPELLAKEMDRLRRSCHRLIWLNPLLGSPRYEPLTRGIQAALPYVDDFLPVHNLISLEQLAATLQNWNVGRARR